ncbi:MAG: hypothetical protein KIT31_16350 [Deltaproteobacteria bacterium]|nr:hypothetical protein [Deltaproteobacteria bacterium]
MSRKSPRFIPPGLVEVTVQTVGRRFLLRPSGELNAAILATLGRALALNPVEVHAVAFLSNHWHGLVSVPDGLALCRFVQHVNSNVARAVNRLTGWNGSVFGKPAYIVVGAASEELRLRYVLSQGVKEGLVRRCVEWPGVHCARALLLEEVLVGRWIDRRYRRQVQAGGRTPGVDEGVTVYPIEFAPLPMWRTLDAGERVRRVRAMVNDIEAEAGAKHPIVVGVSRLVARDPLDRPRTSRHRLAPPIHTSDQDERSQFTMEELTFAVAFDEARERVRRGSPATVPPRCFPPVAPFHTGSAMLWSSARVAVPSGRV